MMLPHILHFGYLPVKFQVVVCHLALQVVYFGLNGGIRVPFKMLKPCINVLLPLASSLLKVLPGPLVVSLVYLVIHTPECIPEPLLRVLFNGHMWPQPPEFVRFLVPRDLRDRPAHVSILFFVQGDTKLIEK